MKSNFEYDRLFKKQRNQIDKAIELVTPEMFNNLLGQYGEYIKVGTNVVMYHSADSKDISLCLRDTWDFVFSVSLRDTQKGKVVEFEYL